MMCASWGSSFLSNRQACTCLMSLSYALSNHRATISAKKPHDYDYDYDHDCDHDYADDHDHDYDYDHDYEYDHDYDYDYEYDNLCNMSLS